MTRTQRKMHKSKLLRIMRFKNTIAILPPETELCFLFSFWTLHEPSYLAGHKESDSLEPWHTWFLSLPSNLLVMWTMRWLRLRCWNKISISPGNAHVVDRRDLWCGLQQKIDHPGLSDTQTTHPAAVLRLNCVQRSAQVAFDLTTQTPDRRIPSSHWLSKLTSQWEDRFQGLFGLPNLNVATFDISPTTRQKQTHPKTRAPLEKRTKIPVPEPSTWPKHQCCLIS